MGSLEEYNILRVIGKGSYGEVHLIQHKKEKKQYVIKKLALLKASKRERKAAELEAKLLSKLRHPNIVSYKDSFEGNDGFLYIVMGFAEGGDLYTKLREHREKKDYLSEVQVVRWFIQICMAIQYLHQRHILHRDLKTQNIFLTKTKMIKVGDLGIAKVLEGATDMATTLIGTPYYMSPELFSNKPYNYKSDIWALGCCAFEIMTLRHAFNAKDMNSLVYKILQRKIPKLPDLYSAELCELIKGMLHQTAEKRPSVNKILRNSFIKQHIQLFLDESSKSRRNANSSKLASNRIKGRDSLKSNEIQTTSSSGHHSQSPQSSTDSPLPNNNQQKSAAAPATTSDDTKNNSNNQKQQNLPTTTDQSTTTTPNNPQQQQPSTTNKQNGINNNNNNHRKQPQTTTAKSKLSPSEIRQIYDEAPSRQQRNERYRIINNNISNNNNRREVKHVTKRTEDVIKSSNKPDVRRVGSSGGDVIQLPIASREPEKRSLPKLPNTNSGGGGKQTSSGNNKEQEISDGNNLASSSESISSIISTASTASKTSSARERRRQRHRIAGHKVAQVRPSSQDSDRSKSAGSNGGGGDNITTNRSNNNNNNNNKKETRRKPSKYSPAAGDAGMEHRETASPSSDENKNEGNGKNGGKEEENQFYSLLHTTLKLSEDDEPSPPISPVNEEEDDNGEKRLSPVPELSESSTSSVLAAATKNPPQKAPKKLNTPDATETRVRFPSNVVNKPQQNPNPVPFRNKVISQATLASTGRLMDRIVALRKDCIRGLGVQLLHRAYELLDEEKDEDRLQDQLIALLGKPRFYQWAGKIWQLKFCEESIFNHCGSITAI